LFKSLSLSPLRCRFHQHFMSGFCTSRSQKHKKDWRLDCLFALLGSAGVKALHKMLMKLTPFLVNCLSISSTVLPLSILLSHRRMGQWPLSQTEKTFRKLIFFLLFPLHRDANAGADRRNRHKFRLENFSHYREGFVAGQQASTSASTTTTTSCIAIFPNCHFEGTAARMLDFSILQYWQKLSDYLPLTITV